MKKLVFRSFKYRISISNRLISPPQTEALGSEEITVETAKQGNMLEAELYKMNSGNTEGKSLDTETLNISYNNVTLLQKTSVLTIPYIANYISKMINNL